MLRSKAMSAADSQPSTIDRLAPLRVPALESIRGLAAVQVVLLHLFSAFVPAIVFYQPARGPIGDGVHSSVLFYLYDGYSAVYVFFLLSGYVLTGPFGRDADRPLAVIVSRWARLAVPAVAACAFAAAVMGLWPTAHMDVGQYTNNTWLRDLWQVPRGPAHFLYDAFVNAIFVGYRDLGSLAALGVRRTGIEPTANAYVVPLWTLSIEFFGSLLVLGLAAARRMAPRLWLPLVALVAVFFFRTPYVCFVAGHIAAVLQLANRRSQVPAIVCLGGLAAGILCCTAAEHVFFAPITWACSISGAWVLPCDDAYHLEKRVGAVLIFLSLIQWNIGRDLLSVPWLARWGRFSFPLYLAHWPIVFGPACYVYLALLRAGEVVAAAGAVTTGFFGTVVAAYGFAYVDAAAMRLSHSLRHLPPRMVTRLKKQDRRFPP